MKGSPNNPKCGFSRTMVGLLKEQNVTYSYFDILTDNSVRQGLKTFSNWPTYPQLYANGELVGGLDVVKELIEEDEFKTSLPAEAFNDNVPTDTAVAELNQRLHQLINMAPVVLFMKGSPDNPKCGFSRTMVGLLQEQNVTYNHFDILTDNSVRQGLKTYSNWPTYPQLYANGELVGGLDVVKELIEEDEFVTSLPSQAISN